MKPKINVYEFGMNIVFHFQEHLKDLTGSIQKIISKLLLKILLIIVTINKLIIELY